MTTEYAGTTPRKCHEQVTERRASCARCKRIFFREDTMSFKNIGATIVIVAVIVGGGLCHLQA
jgi:hypothetical protein